MIRPIIIIVTFGTTNVDVHNGITFSSGIGEGHRDRDIFTVVPYQAIVL